MTHPGSLSMRALSDLLLGAVRQRAHEEDAGVRHAAASRGFL